MVEMVEEIMVGRWEVLGLRGYCEEKCVESIMLRVWCRGGLFGENSVKSIVEVLVWST